MIDELTIIVSSRDDGSEKQDFIDKIKETCGCPARVIFVVNDGKMGLGNLYCSMLSNTGIETDIIVFMHDDVTPLRAGWGRELVDIFERNPEYGIIGVAGSDAYNPQVYGWWNHKGHTWGQVLHRTPEKSWITCFSDLYTYDLEEVCVIDGLFIGIDRRRIGKNFDPDFMWHGYDIDFCLANFLAKKCKIGVTTKIRLAHDSVGPTSDEWVDSMKRIADKYQDFLPVKITKNKRRDND